MKKEKIKKKKRTNREKKRKISGAKEIKEIRMKRRTSKQKRSMFGQFVDQIQNFILPAII